jgi:tRNA(fMet)-specific endonuclease VapC
MLDTNIVSDLIKGRPCVVDRVVAAPMASLCISAVTKGELTFGLAKRPEAKRLHLAVREFLLRVDVAPWDDAIAERYGTLRADLERRGQTLAPLDLMIAAQALELGVALVTNDRTFGRIAGLQVEDWTV